MRNFRKVYPTANQKSAAMAFYAPKASDAPALAWYDPPQTGNAVALMSYDDEFARSDEGQALITADSLRAIAESRRPTPTITTEHAPMTTELRNDQHTLTDARAFMMAGNAVFTVVSKTTGARFTFKVRHPSDDAPHFVSVLTGSDNESDYTFLGTIFADGTYRHGRKSPIGQNAPSACAFAWLWANLDNAATMTKCEIFHEGRCCRCGRRLTVPSSIEAGIGPECANKED